MRCHGDWAVCGMTAREGGTACPNCWSVAGRRQHGHHLQTVGGRIVDKGEETSQEGGLMLGGWQAVELRGKAQSGFVVCKKRDVL